MDLSPYSFLKSLLYFKYILFPFCCSCFISFLMYVLYIIQRNIKCYHAFVSWIFMLNVLSVKYVFNMMKPICFWHVSLIFLNTKYCLVLRKESNIGMFNIQVCPFYTNLSQFYVFIEYENIEKQGDRDDAQEITAFWKYMYI